MKFYKSFVVLILSVLNVTLAFDAKLAEETLFKIREEKLVREVSRIESFLQSIEEEENKIKNFIDKPEKTEKLASLHDLKPIGNLTLTNEDKSRIEKDALKNLENNKPAKTNTTLNNQVAINKLKEEEQKENELLERLEKKLELRNKLKKIKDEIIKAKKETKLTEKKEVKEVESDKKPDSHKDNKPMVSATSPLTVASNKEGSTLIDLGRENPIYKREGNKLKINTKLLTEKEVKVITDLLDLFANLKVNEINKVASISPDTNEVVVMNKKTKDDSFIVKGEDMMTPKMEVTSPPIQKDLSSNEVSIIHNEVVSSYKGNSVTKLYEKPTYKDFHQPKVKNQQETMNPPNINHYEKPTIKSNNLRATKPNNGIHNYEKPEIKTSVSVSPNISKDTINNSYSNNSNKEGKDHTLYEVTYKSSTSSNDYSPLSGSSKESYKTITKSNSNTNGVVEAEEEIGSKSNSYYYDRSTLRNITPAINSFSSYSNSSPSLYSSTSNYPSSYSNQYTPISTMSTSFDRINKIDPITKTMGSNKGKNEYYNYNFKQKNISNGFGEAIRAIDYSDKMDLTNYNLRYGGNMYQNQNQNQPAVDGDYGSIMADYYNQLS